MANSKISALTAATTPLAGTETLPVVQSSATTKVTVANLTAGRDVSASGLFIDANSATNAVRITQLGAGNALLIEDSASTDTTPFVIDASGNVGIGITAPLSKLQATGQSRLGSASNAAFSGTLATGGLDVMCGSGTRAFQVWDDNVLGTPRFFVERAGNVTVSSGNVIQGTAARGFNFTANTPVAGMTSQLLNWYEEGTFTPNQGAGLTLVGAFSSTGRYTRIGRQVSISGTVTGATSVAVTAAGVITSNLPFTVVTAGHGGATNVANNASATVICTGTSVTSAAVIAATATITFSATYFV